MSQGRKGNILYDSILNKKLWYSCVYPLSQELKGGSERRWLQVTHWSQLISNFLGPKTPPAEHAVSSSKAARIKYLNSTGKCNNSKGKFPFDLNTTLVLADGDQLARQPAGGEDILKPQGEGGEPHK